MQIEDNTKQTGLFLSPPLAIYLIIYTRTREAVGAQNIHTKQETEEEKNTKRSEKTKKLQTLTFIIISHNTDNQSFTI